MKRWKSQDYDKSDKGREACGMPSTEQTVEQPLAKLPGENAEQLKRVQIRWVDIQYGYHCQPAIHPMELALTQIQIASRTVSTKVLVQ